MKTLIQILIKVREQSFRIDQFCIIDSGYLLFVVRFVAVDRMGRVSWGTSQSSENVRSQNKRMEVNEYSAIETVTYNINLLKFSRKYKFSIYLPRVVTVSE